MVSKMTEPILMPIGKYEGKPIDQVPTDYLRWILYKVYKRDHILLISQELQRRKGEIKVDI